MFDKCFFIAEEVWNRIFWLLRDTVTPGHNAPNAKTNGAIPLKLLLFRFDKEGAEEMK